MARSPKPWYWKARKSWFVTIDGQRHNLGRDRQAAYSRFHQMMAKPITREVRADSVLRIIDAFLEWTAKHRAPATYRWYRDFLQSFVDSLPGDLSIDSLRPFHIQTWVDSRQCDSQSTTRGCVTAAKRVFRWAEEQGYIDRSPVAHLPKPECGRRERLISEDEYSLLMSSIPDEAFRDLVTVAWEIGPRPQELTQVETSHVDLENERWIIPQEKAKGKKSPRVIYLTEKALKISKKWLENNSGGCLFRNLRGQPWTKTAINSRFSRLKKTIGTKFCLYMFRHTYATRLLHAGVDSLTVAILLGHRDPGTLAKVYQHLSQNPQHLRGEARRAAS